MNNALGFRLNVRQNLDTTGSGTNQGHILVCPVELGIPAGCVHQLAFKVLEPVDFRPLPFVQDTGSFDENIGGLSDDLEIIRQGGYYYGRRHTSPETKF